MFAHGIIRIKVECCALPKNNYKEIIFVFIAIAIAYLELDKLILVLNQGCSCF